MNLGEKLKFLREKKGLTQQELSNLSGVNRATIGNYERGARIPNIEILKKLSHALDIDINNLINLENKNAWEKNIDLLAEPLGLNIDNISNAPKELKDKFFTDISDIPIYKMQIQAVLKLIKNSNDEKLQKLFYVMLESIVSELNKKNDTINNLELKLQKISQIVNDKTKENNLNQNELIKIDYINNNQKKENENSTHYYKDPDALMNDIQYLIRIFIENFNLLWNYIDNEEIIFVDSTMKDKCIKKINHVIEENKIRESRCKVLNINHDYEDKMKYINYSLSTLESCTDIIETFSDYSNNNQITFKNKYIKEEINAKILFISSNNSILKERIKHNTLTLEDLSGDNNGNQEE